MNKQELKHFGMGGLTLVPMDEPASSLFHHGVKGMKWGVRRYQNKDGTTIGRSMGRGTKKSNSKKEVSSGGRNTTDDGIKLNKFDKKKSDMVQEIAKKYIAEYRQGLKNKGLSDLEIDNFKSYEKDTGDLYEKAFEKVYAEKWSIEAEVRNSGDKDLKKWYDEEKKLGTL